MSDETLPGDARDNEVRGERGEGCGDRSLCARAVGSRDQATAHVHAHPPAHEHMPLLHYGLCDL